MISKDDIIDYANREGLSLDRYLLDPEEIESLMDDLYGAEYSLRELAQVLLDGGWEIEHLQEQYMTSKGMKSLMVIIACQDDLEFDREHLVRRIEKFYDDLGEKISMIKAKLESEVDNEVASPTAYAEEDEASPADQMSVEVEVPVANRNPNLKELELVPAHENEDKGEEEIVFVPRNQRFPRFGEAPVWDPSTCIEGLNFARAGEPGARILHSGWVQPEYTVFPDEVQERVKKHRDKSRGFKGLPLAKGGFRPTTWLQVVKVNFPDPESALLADGWEIPTELIEDTLGGAPVYVPDDGS